MRSASASTDSAANITSATRGEHSATRRLTCRQTGILASEQTRDREGGGYSSRKDQFHPPWMQDFRPYITLHRHHHYRRRRRTADGRRSDALAISSSNDLRRGTERGENAVTQRDGGRGRL